MNGTKPKAALTTIVLLAVLALGVTSAQAASTTLVISQFQVAGGSAADEFVEIHNVSAASVDLNGHILVYRSAAGTSDVSLISWSASTIIPAGGFYLVGSTPGYDGGGANATYADGGSGRLAGAGGGLALRLGAANTGTIVDSVGFGTATNAFVETTVTPAPAANNSASRKSSGCQDTDNNSSDFQVTTPSSPRNASSSAVSCGPGDSAPGVSGTTPANGATGVAIAANVDITFSEAVNAAAGWYTISCGISGSHTAAVSGGATTFTLNPDTDFGNSETCTVTVLAANITDQDASDPPDAMAADYAFSFNTVPLVEPKLLISEYVEGSSNNKGLEIFNATASAVDLGAQGYRIELYFNGGTSAGQTIGLTGTLAAGDVFVLANTSASFAGQADQTSGSVTFNGDDAIVLRRGAGGPVIDSLGQVGSDPGTEWGTGLTSTADNTIRRKATICQGDTITNDAFDPSTEWDGYATDTFAGLGDHFHSCAGVPNALRSTGAANPPNVDPGAGTLLTVTVTPGTLPSSTGITVTGDLTAIGGSATQTFFDDGSNGDVTIGDNVFTFTATVPLATPPGGLTLPIAVADGQGRTAPTTIALVVNAPLTPIHDIQGAGSTSPMTGQTVMVRGIVTGVKSNGFFVQEEDADADLDPATSEGIFVFTSGAPPAAAAFASHVQVSGTVAEFVPSGDPQQPPVTELTSPTVVQVAAAQPLPTAVPLTTTFPDPAGAFDQLERVEGMRVTVSSLTVVGPSDGSFNETSLTPGSSNGRFHAVVTGVARPFREPGIQQPDVPPTGTIPPIPRWDFNPERLRIESATIGQPILTVKTNDVVGPVAGPLDYGFRGYAVYIDSTLSPVVTPGTLPTVVTAPAPTEFTVTSFNMERLFDDTDDPFVGDPVVPTVAYQNRLQKASIAIRNHLLFPDILGVQEADSLSVLQDLSAKISADAIADSQPDPLYEAYLVEGNDVGGIDVGYLVKTAEVALGVPRVAVIAVTQEGKTFTWVDPKDNVTKALNDRPPLVLEATVNHPNGASFDVTVINNHLKSLIGVDSNVMDGLTTEGDRNRQKRQAQAAYLAALVQARQTADPAETIVLVGDFNAFEFNDGYGDVINTILGTPPPDNETVVAGDGIDFVNPDLVNLTSLQPAAERYSYSFDGNAQTLDHAIVNQALIGATTARRVERPRLGADYPDTERNTNTTAFRLSDHDPLVAYFDVPAFTISDISINDVTVTEGNAGTTTATFTVSLSAAHPTAISVDWTTTDNTATAGGDFTGASGTVTFTPGVTTRPIVVDVTGDLMFELDETFFVDLSNVIGPGNLLDAQGIGTITNDDGVPTISIADLSAMEGSGGGTTPFTFTVSLSNPSSLAVTVTAMTADGSATSTFDFAPTTALLTFAPGVVTQPFVVPVVADVQNETDETFFVDLQAPANATLLDGQAIGTILNDDDAFIVSPDPVIVADCLPVIGGPCMFTAVSASGANQDGWSYTWYIDGVPAGSGQTFSPQFPGPGTYVITVDVMSNGEIGSASVTITILPSCPVDALCMQNGRFEIRLVATDPRTGTVANGVPLQENGQFGFFALPDLTGSTENPEVFVKILDGQPVNGSFWVFFGGLTDLEYVLTVTDTVTGEVKTYTKPAGSSGGGFDVGSGVTPESCIGEVNGTPADPVAPGSCTAGSDRLCLLGGRFRIELAARDQRTGTTGTGLSIPENDMFGYFALPELTSDPTNPEVFVKVVDGRVVNGHFWIFFAGLTDLEYTVKVTDTTTGVVKSYTKAPGSACGGFDTDGF